MATLNRIYNHGKFVDFEYTTAADVYPGYIVELTSAGTVQAHSTAGGLGEVLIVVENALEGIGITDVIDSGEVAQCYALTSGSTVQIRIANGETIVIGDFLSSNGDGTFKKYVNDSSAVIDEEVALMVALEAIDMSGSSAVDPDGFCIARKL